MKQFNWEEFLEEKNKIAVHCKTEEEAKDFCKQMHEHGMKWKDSDSYLGITYWDKYRDKTCYSNRGGYTSYGYYEKEKYKILEWSDYMKKEFKKADLRDGMVIEWRIGDRFLLLGDRFITYDGFEKLEGYDNDLNHVNCNKDYDIVKVFVAKHNSVKTIKNLFDDENLELIWERQETKSMTTEEMCQKLEELTGEKIEVELSREEMIGTIKIYCNGRSCKTCILNNKCLVTNIHDMTKEQLKRCYKDVMKDVRKES